MHLLIPPGELLVAGMTEYSIVFEKETHAINVCVFILINVYANLHMLSSIKTYNISITFIELHA